MDPTGKVEMVWKSDAGVVSTPTWVTLKEGSNILTKVEDESAILDVTTIKDKNKDNMCTFQISQVDIPDEFASAGLKFES